MEQSVSSSIQLAPKASETVLTLPFQPSLRLFEAISQAPLLFKKEIWVNFFFRSSANPWRCTQNVLINLQEFARIRVVLRGLNILKRIGLGKKWIRDYKELMIDGAHYFASRDEYKAMFGVEAPPYNSTKRVSGGRSQNQLRGLRYTF